MGRTVASMLAVLAVIVASAGCSARSGAAAPTAVVTGVFYGVGGPAPGLPRPLSGIIEAHRGTSTDGPVVASVTAGASGAFTVRLPVGTFVLAAAGADGSVPCLSRPFNVGSSGSVTADVICDWD